MPIPSGYVPITLIVTEEFKTEFKMYCVKNGKSLQSYSGKIFTEVGRQLMLKADPVKSKEKTHKQ